MSKQRRTGSNLAFNDLLFNVLIGFVMLFVIAFLLINPITKKNDVPSKAEIMIILEWDDELADDVDLWVMRDNNRPVGFSNKVNAPLHLDRDDLGWSNDQVTIDGRTQIIRSNIETTTVRGLAQGTYYVAVHMYSKRTSGPIKFSVTVMQVNPFKQAYSIPGEILNNRDIIRLPAFTVDENNRIVDVFAHTRNIVPKGREM